MRRDLQELEKSIYSKYKEIVSIIPVQRAGLIENSKKLTTWRRLTKRNRHYDQENEIRSC